jgi:hypothetical protein
MAPDHVSGERLTEIVTHDNVPFTQQEIDHLTSCEACFNQWEHVIATVSPDDSCPADAT